MKRSIFVPAIIIVIAFIAGGCQPAATADVPEGGGPQLAREPKAGTGGTEIILPGGGAATPVAPDPNLGGGTGGGTASAAKDMAKEAAAKAGGSTAAPTEEPQ